MVIVPIGLLAQGQITGTVTSSDDGFPLPGTSVIIKGTTIGGTTDFDGNFTIDIIDTIL